MLRADLGGTEMEAALASTFAISVRGQVEPAPAQPRWASALPDCVFDGDTINLFAQFAGQVQGEVRLYGRGADDGEQEIGMTATAWPPCVFALAAFDVAHESAAAAC